MGAGEKRFLYCSIHFAKIQHHNATIVHCLISIVRFPSCNFSEEPFGIIVASNISIGLRLLTLILNVMTCAHFQSIKF